MIQLTTALQVERELEAIWGLMSRMTMLELPENAALRRRIESSYSRLDGASRNVLALGVKRFGRKHRVAFKGVDHFREEFVIYAFNRRIGPPLKPSDPYFWDSFGGDLNNGSWPWKRTKEGRRVYIASAMIRPLFVPDAFGEFYRLVRDPKKGAKSFQPLFPGHQTRSVCRRRRSLRESATPSERFAFA